MTFNEALAAVESTLPAEVHQAIYDERERLYCAIQDAAKYMRYRTDDDAAYQILEQTLIDSELT